MKLLFDQGVPVPLRQHLRGHEVTTVYERGWNALKNGQLISTAELDGFEALITTDQNLKYQQNLSTRKIAIAVLLSTSWPRIQKHLTEVRALLMVLLLVLTSKSRSPEAEPGARANGSS